MPSPRITALPAHIDNYAPYLSSMLTIKRRPMTLDDHFVFSPMFSAHMPPYLVWRAGRQIGKSRSSSGRLIIQSAAKPGHETMVVLPLQEQSDRISSVVFKPMIEDSPIQSVLGIDDTIGSVRRRQFLNGSITHFTYAWLTTERARSLTAAWLYIDEAQDMDPAHVPVLVECLSAESQPVVIVSGTSKSKSTFLEQGWERSSQGIWQIKCTACGFDNVCALEPDGHMIKMIGPVRDDISEKAPGTVCARCQRPVSPRYGRWVHRKPELARDVAGYFSPQIVMPGHYANPVKWSQLVGKMNGAAGYTTAKFYNEVLGEAFDAAYKMVGEDDLRKAARGIGPNTEADAARRARTYDIVILGVDWGGGGADGVSRTKVAAVGFPGDGSAEVFFGAQFQPSTDRVAEGREVLRLAAGLNARVIAHDYNGAGTASEAVVTHLGWPIDRICPMVYRQTIGGEMVEYQKPARNRTRGYYVLDKGKSLQFICMAIRAGRVFFFDYDYIDSNRPGLINDFTSLTQDNVDTPTGQVYRVRKLHESMTDDFAHAVNFACCAGWELTRGWPDLTRAGSI